MHLHLQSLATNIFRKARRRAAAFSLVEVTLALGIVAFCLVPMVGMLPLGMRNDQMAIEQTAANTLLSAVAADLRATALNISYPSSGTSAQFGVTIPGDPAATQGTPVKLYFTSEGQFVQQPSPDAKSHYLMTIQFLANTSYANGAQPAASPAPKMASMASLQVSWPAAAPVSQAAGTAQMFVAMDRR